MTYATLSGAGLPVGWFRKLAVRFIAEPADEGIVASWVMVLRRDGRCLACGAPLAAGTEAFWDAEAKTTTCLVCRAAQERGAATDPVALGTHGDPGASAQREYDRRSERERTRQAAAVAHDADGRAAASQAHPILGRIASAMIARPKVQETPATTAWKTGASGEAAVGAALLDVPGIVVLHDRRIRGSRANIDHIVIGQTGVHVVDAKRYTGKVQHTVTGTVFRPDHRLTVGGRNRSSLLAAMARQVEVVRAAVPEPWVPIHPTLCFVDAEWGPFQRRPW